MSKAYDRVEWSFLESMTRIFGFDELWIGLIMECVITVKYRVKVNGNLSRQFCATERTEAGRSPLSLSLFIVC